MGINVNLTSHLEELVRSKVASGQYTSFSEVVCEALRLSGEQIQSFTLFKRSMSVIGCVGEG